MKLRIEYCSEWNYRPRAASLADEARKRFQAESELIAGHGGVYKVWLDGELIWDKKAMGGFPDEDELLARIGSAKG